jgi:hypothetical protein
MTSNREMMVNQLSFQNIHKVSNKKCVTHQMDRTITLISYLKDSHDYCAKNDFEGYGYKVGYHFFLMRDLEDK